MKRRRMQSTYDTVRYVELAVVNDPGMIEQYDEDYDD